MIVVKTDLCGCVVNTIVIAMVVVLSKEVVLNIRTGGGGPEIPIFWQFSSCQCKSSYGFWVSHKSCTSLPVVAPNPLCGAIPPSPNFKNASTMTDVLWNDEKLSLFRFVLLSIYFQVKLKRLYHGCRRNEKRRTWTYMDLDLTGGIRNLQVQTIFFSCKQRLKTVLSLA